ncbi:hypothetical protein CGLO_17948 [Colletotrichum gloeosporioides Cg-14]|uniref:Uncharacterized protein n=1 Tax=Colletotrichum gloeosporioides (strain Cg-14) TaxID=1237896 RepID=T0JS93_COLGC|nr:hypothetical protein CGLO_17948 [Colletotrichum gloeosporioides Cg-14]
MLIPIPLEALLLEEVNLEIVYFLEKKA